MRFSLFFIGLTVALLVLAVPTGAVNGTISIAYRGPGGNYLGDTIIFDGYNTFSNTTLIRLTGPGLPAEGVPVYNMNGEPGTGNLIPVSEKGFWKFVWYTASIQGLEKLQTARYHITVFDSEYPDQTSTTSIMLKKPEFYVVATPGTAQAGEYVELTGSSDVTGSSVHFEITDSSGQTVHAYDSSVSGSGYFNKGFHVDMSPGVYTITMSSPATRYTYQTYMTVVLPPTPTPARTSTSGDSTGSTTDVTPVQPAGGFGTLTISSSPAGATVFIDSTMIGTTPYEQQAIASGTHLVEIKAPGYTTFAAQVVIQPGETTNVNQVLSRTPSSVPVSLATIMAGLIVSLGVLAAVAGRKRQ